jgi:hypothetical protein
VQHHFRHDVPFPYDYSWGLFLGIIFGLFLGAFVQVCPVLPGRVRR